MAAVTGSPSRTSSPGPKELISTSEVIDSRTSEAAKTALNEPNSHHVNPEVLQRFEEKKTVNAEKSQSTDSQQSDLTNEDDPGCCSRIVNTFYCRFGSNKPKIE